MTDEIAPFSVKLLRFRNGERFPAVVDCRGLLAAQPNVYALLSLRPREQAAATSEQRLRAVCTALNWAESRALNFKARIETFELLSSYEVEDLKDALRVSARATKGQGAKSVVGAAQFVDRCHAVRDYVAWHAKTALQRIRVGDPRLGEARLCLDRFIKMMNDGLPRSGKSDKVVVGDGALQAMLAAAAPGCDENPFQTQHQHRNFALLLLYYETGMRRGEALKLKGQDLNLQGENPSVTVARRPDDADDRRRVAPQVKTLGRTIPITKHLAHALRVWITEHRTDARRYPDARRTPFVFVSRAGQALGLRTVNDMYELLRKRVAGLPAELTTHANRHAANSRFSAGSKELGWNDAETALARNYHFGWVKGSDQGVHYNKEYVRKMSEAYVASIQRKSAPE
ncbi:tyrosine-type recombinase/integrase [Chenggangzhangella methanolivorans]|uniref:Site-specific integrase n=2 Tax=Hyphomicrobiales TaxID=356 RepID=A0A9E6UMM4_9HYPH|nr:site-specific integrase [Chenggangzhangella methanolivorans]PZQ18078.1 MAG: hypothetical protein DI565_05050 [Ancylobacter novellus]QZO00151.1 site-specific integrase [Chenggangzhangella methanolivorans]HML44353.1 site-specific integrase [Hyphomicrobium zavarzinii]